MQKQQPQQQSSISLDDIATDATIARRLSERCNQLLQMAEMLRQNSEEIKELKATVEEFRKQLEEKK